MRNYATQLQQVMAISSVCSDGWRTRLETQPLRRGLLPSLVDLSRNFPRVLNTKYHGFRPNELITNINSVQEFSSLHSIFDLCNIFDWTRELPLEMGSGVPASHIDHKKSRSMQMRHTLF